MNEPRPRAGSDDYIYIDLGPSKQKGHKSRNHFSGTVKQLEAILREWFPDRFPPKKIE